MMLEAEERGIQRGREEGEERGIERINKLYSFLIKEKRFEDLERSANDGDFQKQLMEQYGI